MESASKDTVTRLLVECRKGQRNAVERILPLLYDDLRRIAKAQLRRDRHGHTLSPTSLVHEAYLRLIHENEQNWEHRLHFLSLAAQVIRRVLVDHARARATDKRSGKLVQT